MVSGCLEWVNIITRISDSPRRTSCGNERPNACGHGLDVIYPIITAYMALYSAKSHLNINFRDSSGGSPTNQGFEDGYQDGVLAKIR
ncbi:hypothetical protein AAMO2058_001389600 [Amorphochlora amoebiformis]